jgi:hypothetical protein
MMDALQAADERSEVREQGEMILALALSGSYNLLFMEHVRFSDQIRDAVNASELSRYRICAEIKLSQPAMSRFMAGRSGLSMEVLDRLAELLGFELKVKRPSRRGD